VGPARRARTVAPLKGDEFMPGSFRRVVTGHNEAGDAIVLSDAPPARVVQVGGPAGPTFFEIWSTAGAPAPIVRGAEEPVGESLVLAPPPGGTRIRIMDFPPEGEEIRRLGAAGAAEKFGAMGDAAVSQFKAGSHPLMHRTATVDYAIVIEGEMTMILDGSETQRRAGDVVIQRGTRHAWSNRSGRTCRMAFVLIDGRFGDGL